jgi:D,D-heptose 1,7-bisphosphate phosphatase
VFRSNEDAYKEPEMIVVIVAGGKGTRLGLADSPKPMVEMAGKPLLEHQVDLAKRYGFLDFYVLSGFFSEKIIDYFGDGSRFGVRIHHVTETRPLGTAGSVKQLEGLIHDTFMVFYGDVLMDVCLPDMLSFHRDRPGIATILVHPNDHPFDSDLLDIDANGYVDRFYPKPRPDAVYYRNLVNAGLYIFEPEIFQYIQRDVESDFGRDVLPFLLDENEKIKAYYTAEYVKDIGTRERLLTCTNDFLKGRVFELNRSNPRRAVFLDRDGVINREADCISEMERFELLEGSSEAVRKINSSNYMAVVITNQPAIAKGFCTEDQLRQVHNKMETVLGREGAYIDYLYYCPHHPEKGFEGERSEYKINCECRKPRTGLIEKARQDFNIDLQESFLIGDRTVDVMAAVNAGMRSILVRSGYGGKDNSFPCQPDFVFDNLGDSVDFILDSYDVLFEKATEILSKAKRPARDIPVAVVAGLSRSGKSSFSRIIAMALEKEGINAKVINLDDWLISADKRQSWMTVRERYEYAKLEGDLRDLLLGNVVSISKYDAKSRTSSGTCVSVSLRKGEYLIIDGTVGLDVKYIRDIGDLKIYVEAPEDLRRRRFLNFYRFKGLSETEAAQLYIERERDETPIIASTKKFADHVIRMEAAN